MGWTFIALGAVLGLAALVESFVEQREYVTALIVAATLIICGVVVITGDRVLVELRKERSARRRWEKETRG